MKFQRVCLLFWHAQYFILAACYKKCELYSYLVSKISYIFNNKIVMQNHQCSTSVNFVNMCMISKLHEIYHTCTDWCNRGGTIKRENEKNVSKIIIIIKPRMHWTNYMFGKNFCGVCVTANSFWFLWILLIIKRLLVHAKWLQKRWESKKNSFHFLSVQIRVFREFKCCGFILSFFFGEIQ